MNIFKKFKAYLRFHEAMRQADKAYAETNQRHYVLPSPNGMLIIVNHENFRGLRRKGYVNKQNGDLILKKDSLYYTPYGNGKRGMNEQTQQKRFKHYLRFLEDIM